MEVAWSGESVDKHTFLWVPGDPDAVLVGSGDVSRVLFFLDKRPLSEHSLGVRICHLG